MSPSWPAQCGWFLLPGEPAQAEYELLRAHVIEHGRPPSSLAATRFARRGLAGLIVWPHGECALQAELVGARRPAWSPHHDPRLDTLAAVVAVLLEAAGRLDAGRSDGSGRWAR
ncbi:hypothetical protein BX265_7747 [Streptomyces sp. TLI_235]|nr:hypothetical protein [Streptomyces sp. TLI_235]PBC66311.1 hypothetical protein BX265_8378 [Streptomyces sp. TLI_235]PBC70333.1 hypothetical protein BX265_7747 [Streptomyces sp. TLI_235]